MYKTTLTETIHGLVNFIELSGVLRKVGES